MSLHYLVTHNMCQSVHIRQLLCKYPSHAVDFVFFTNEKLFTVASPVNRRMPELCTDYDQEEQHCCWLPAPQTTHIQRERYGQQDNAPAHCARETIELLRNETRILSHQTCRFPTVLTSILWTTRYREWCRNVFTRSRWGTLMSWSSIRLQHGRESNRASLIKQLISDEVVLMRG